MLPRAAEAEAQEKKGGWRPLAVPSVFSSRHTALRVCPPPPLKRDEAQAKTGARARLWKVRRLGAGEALSAHPPPPQALYSFLQQPVWAVTLSTLRRVAKVT